MIDSPIYLEQRAAFLKCLLDGDASVIPALIDLEVEYHPHSLAIDRLKHLLKDYADRPEKLCQYALTDGMNACPKCASMNTSVHNFNEVWRDGDVMCDDCGAYVRGYDAG